MEHDREERDQNLPHTRVCQLVIDKKPHDKSKSEILAHCQKIVDDILKEYPKGFKMSVFRILFLDRHGYSLYVQKAWLPKIGMTLWTSFL